jgi:hypothetical protein
MVLKMTAHQYEETRVEPLCEATGSHVLTCRLCGDTRRQVLPAPGHDFGAWTMSVSPDCAREGLETSVCARCGIVIKRAIPCLPHQAGAWETLRPATCLTPGLETATCLVCGQTLLRGTALAAHSFGDWIEPRRADCSLAGIRYRVCAWCARREEQAVAPRKHAYDKWVIVAASTCTAQGMRERQCRHCDFVQTEALPLRKHIAGRWAVAVPAELFTPGLQEKACKTCGLVMDTRPYYPGDRAFAVSFCALGPRLRDVWPQEISPWYRFMLLDLSRDGQTVLPLVAADSHQVGEVTAVVADGRFSVSYSLFGKRSRVWKERLHMLVPGQAVTAGFAEASRQGLRLSTADNIVFHSARGEAAVLLLLRLEGVFDRDDPANRRINWQAANPEYKRVIADMDAQARLLFGISNNPGTAE